MLALAGLSIVDDQCLWFFDFGHLRLDITC